MFETISGISIKGRCFTDEKALDFFSDPQKNRLALIYGQNGSGKTTCAKGFARCANPHLDSDELTAQLRDVEATSQKLPTPDNGWNNIHIFDEDYVVNNLRIDADGLGSIVLLGEQVDIDTQLGLLRTQQSEGEKERIPLQEKLEQLSDISFEGSPFYIKDKIFSKLKASGAWAEIDRIIKGNKVNSRVDDVLFNEFRNMSISEKLEDLQAEFNTQKALYEQTDGNECPYPHPIQNETELPAIDEQIINLLIRTVERPELSDRDKKIFEILTSPFNHKDEIVLTFSAGDTSICPYCFQSVSSEYKKELLKTITVIFNREADLLKSEITQIKINEITRDFTQFASLDIDSFRRIQATVEKCNFIIREYNKYLDEKYNNVFIPISIASLDLEGGLKELNKYISQLEAKRRMFMSVINERTAIKDRLLSLNKMIYRKITEDLFAAYEKSLIHFSDTNIKLTETKNRLAKIETQITELNQKKENIFIAIEQINQDLQYVFFSRDRICLEPHGSKYILKVNGKNVKPKDVSCGERNAIALCYFFTESFNRKNLNNAYKEESLFVIDDPVSSFDIGNRVGINSYLKHKVQRIIDGNKNSKVLVFSHDIVTVWDLEKSFQEICKERENTQYQVKELESFSLKDFQSKKRNEYTNLMCMSYDFAVNQAGDSRSIGNIIRRMLEAFSTFIYKKGIEELSYSTDISHLFGNKSVFFNNLMYRLVLHGESHAEDAVRACSDELLCFCYATDEEKQKMARYILSMLYMLQKEHILIHLRSKGNDARQNIEQWLCDIPENTITNNKIVEEVVDVREK